MNAFLLYFFTVVLCSLYLFMYKYIYALDTYKNLESTIADKTFEITKTITN